MNNFYQELNWPQIPEEFCITDENILEDICQPAHPVPDYLFYRQYKFNNSTLRNTLQPLFNFDITGRIFYQIIKKGISTHKDVGRKIIYNYVLEQGGSEVYTNFYDEDKITELFSVNIPANKWHQMDVSYYHNVIGIEIPRVAISVYERF